MASQYRRRSLMLNTIAKVAQGNPTIITDSSSRRLQKLNIYGQSSQDGTPTSESPVEIISKEVSEIKVTGKNLANIQEFEKIYDGNTFEALYENDKITYSGGDDWSGCGIVLNQTFKKGQYTIQGKGVIMLLSDIAFPSFEYNEYWNGKGYPYIYKFSQLNPKVSFNSDFPFKIGFIGGDINAGKSTVSGTIEQVQIELSSEATSYEPYKAQTINLTSPITLRGIPVDNGGNVTIDGQQYVSDVITEKDGVIGVESNCYLKELEIADMNNYEDYPGWKKVDDIYIFAEDGKADVLNNRLSNITTKLNTVFFNTIKTNDYTNKILYLSKVLFDGKNQTEIKESYPNLTVVFVFERLEPTFEPLPEDVQSQIKALKSYYPNTVIQTGCWNEVTYSAKRGG